MRLLNAGSSIRMLEKMQNTRKVSPTAGAYYEAIKLLDLLEHSDYRAMLAGGCVRDQLLGRAPVDYDIATAATPEQMLGLLKAAGYQVIPTGIKHGTLTVLTAAGPVEVTTLRKDVKTDGRHALVEFSSNFIVDASRRDFTINALFQDRMGIIYDFFGGIDDLQKSQLRFIGEAKKRIEEDYLRILRFFRFWAKYQLSVLERDLKTMTELSAGLQRVSKERIMAELLQILSFGSPGVVIETMENLGILDIILPKTVDNRSVKERAVAAAIDHITDPDLELQTCARLGLLILNQNQVDAKNSGDIYKSEKVWLKTLTQILKLSRRQAQIVSSCMFVDLMVAKSTCQADDLNILEWLRNRQERTDINLTAIKSYVSAGAILNRKNLMVIKSDHEKVRRWMENCSREMHRLDRLPLSVAKINEHTGGQLNGAKLGKTLSELTKKYRNGEWNSESEGLKELERILLS